MLRRAVLWAVVLGVALWGLAVVPTLAAPPEQGSQTTHVVQPGETLSGIARQYGVSVAALSQANNLIDPNHVEAGHRLVIPGSEEAPSSGAPLAEYAVRPGDSLAYIAQRFGTTADDLARLNHLANPNLIYAGQRLVLPGAGTDAPEVVRPRGGQVYIVQSGDTMALIAARHDLSVWAIAQANLPANPNVLYAGQRLVLPLGEDASSLPMPFLELDVLPAVASQGQTVRVVVHTEGEAKISGEFDGRPLAFVADDDAGVGWYRALIGVPGMAGPGPYNLDLRAATLRWETFLQTVVHVVQGRFGAQYIQLPAHKAHLLDPTVVAQESERLRQVTSPVALPGLWQSPFRVPLAAAPAPNAYFGVRRSYNGGLVTAHHTGVDYGVGSGTPVYAAAPGRVVLAETLHVRGISAAVDHGRGVMTVYSHLSQINVVVGQQVETGAVLGLVGNTGRSTGAHLHWELRVTGVPVDPLQWTREYIY